MNFLRHAKPQSWLFLVSLSLVASCTTTEIKDARTCSVAGKLIAGGICSHTLTQETDNLTFDQFIDFLEAQGERPDPVNPKKTLPERGAAICMSSEHFGQMKTAMEEMCRQLGSRCSYEI